MADLPDLLIGFFQFWLKFDFHSNKVDAKTGEMTRKRNPNDNVEVFGLLMPRNVAIPCKMKWVYKLRDCCKDAMKSKCLMVIADKFKEDKAANMSYYY